MRTPSVLGNQQKMQLMDSNSSSWEIEKKQGQQGDRINVFFFRCPKPNYQKNVHFVTQRNNRGRLKFLSKYLPSPSNLSIRSYLTKIALSELNLLVNCLNVAAQFPN